MSTGEGLRSRFRGALVGTAVGDAVGAPFEGAFFLRSGDLDRIRSDPGRLRYTDDAHMTIGFAESLAACDGFDGEHLARTFARNYAAESWRGYGAGPPQVFRMIEQGMAWNEAGQLMFGGQGSYGNGAAMRVAPAGLAGFGNPERVADLARQSAIITHAHPLGVEGAVLQALSVSHLLQADRANGGLDTEDYLGWLRSALGESDYKERLDAVRELLPAAESRAVVSRLGNGIAAIEAVPAALCSFLQSPDSFEGVVSYAIQLGGDTDTIAAMAGANAGAYLGEEAIPEVWRQNVEGVERMRELADELLEMATRSGRG